MVSLEHSMHQGAYADVKVTQREGRPLVVKRYGERAAGLTLTSAQELSIAIRRFGDIAKSIGVPVPTPDKHEFIESPSGGVFLEETVPYVGVDLRSRFADPSVSDTQVLTSVRKYLSLFGKVMAHGYPIALDPPLANFCESADGTVWYIDTYPPMQRKDNKILYSEFPEPEPSAKNFIDSRYFSRLQIQIIYAQLLRDLSSRPGITPELIKNEMMTTFGEHALVFIDFSQQHKAEILTNPLPQHSDAMRIIAAEDTFVRANPALLEEIYGLTHINPGGILPQEGTLRQCAEFVKGARGATIFDASSVNNVYSQQGSLYPQLEQ